MSIQEQVPTTKRHWYAIKCKFRCEKKLAIDLTERGIEIYLPLIRKTKQYQSRKKQSSVALIPSHLFVKIDRSTYLEVLKHPHVFNFLTFSGALSTIPQEEMNLMKRVVGEYEDIAIHTENYHYGDKVEIISGELTGLRGRLFEKCNHNFKIELESLGMGLIIYIDPKNLLRVNPRVKVA